MAVDPSIALGGRGIEVQSPLNQYAQASQIQAYQRQNELANRAIAQEDALNRAYAASVGANGEIDQDKLRQNVIGANLGAKLPTVEKTFLEGRKLKTEVGKGELELEQSRKENSMRQMASYNTREDALRQIDADLAAKKITLQQAQQFASMVPANDADMPKFQLQMLRGMLTPKELLEQHFTPQDTGGGGRVIANFKYAGGGPAQVVPGSQFTKSATIADKLADEKFKWEKANPGFELKEAEDGSIVGVNKRTLQAFPVTMGGGAAPVNPVNPAAPAAGPRVPATPAATPATQAIPGMNSVLDQAAPAATTPAPAAAIPLKGKATSLTESQSNATAFGMRMLESNQLLNDLEKGGVFSGGRIKGFAEGTLNALVPYQGEKLAAGAGAVMNVLPGVLGGPNSEQQQYQQAKLNFMTGDLRKESGASISPSEYETEDRKYFPQPGDTDKVIAQKKRARELAIEAMKIQAGPGAKHIGGGGGGGKISPSATDPLGLGLRPGG